MRLYECNFPLGLAHSIKFIAIAGCQKKEKYAQAEDSS